MNLIANSGIQLFTTSLKINKNDSFKMMFHEWRDGNLEGPRLNLNLLYEIKTDDGNVYLVNKKELYDHGFFAPDYPGPISWNDVQEEFINPVKINDEMCGGYEGDIFKMTFADTDNKLSCFENVWLPLPYFPKRTATKFDFEAFNWARFKMVPVNVGNSNEKSYNVIIAFDTRAKYGKDKHGECPVFEDGQIERNFEVCSDEFLLMDYCASECQCNYIDKYIMSLVHPLANSVDLIKGSRHKYAYIASYIYLINYIAHNNLFPKITLYNDKNVSEKDVDMIVDIGNSRTTALLVEDNSNFNQICHLNLMDFTNPLVDRENPILRIYKEPFDMRLAFRKVDFGDIPILNSKQFVYPSLVRLGKEANALIHKTSKYGIENTLSTYSSPKRYLWDNKPSEVEWNFLVLDNEKDDPQKHILNLTGITNQLKKNGSIDLSGLGGKSFHYSRRSLMTFAFLEMLVQARMQINSVPYREFRGEENKPRKIRRIIVTCPTAMSRLEREALIKCAKDAVLLLENFEYDDPSQNTALGKSVEVVPASAFDNDGNPKWYYDEATCSQLVYMYSEIAHKYKGKSDEFFDLYGKKTDSGKSQLTVGSLDIGAGTSDLMICNYDCKDGANTAIIPTPLFYDSFYYAGDDILKELIRNALFDSQDSPIRKRLSDISQSDFEQKIKNAFGPDYAGQSNLERKLRRDFNLQVSVPLACHYLDLLNNKIQRCIVRYSDVFDDSEPNEQVLNYFEDKFGIDFKSIEWDYDSAKIADIVKKSFEPLLKKISAIMYAYSCDIVVLSGRPSSLPPIEELFLKYYAVSPNRLIMLNNYYVGDWYPFGNNTGFIKMPKTIVAVGAMLGYYASEYSNLYNFTIDTSILGRDLKSTIKYIYPNVLDRSCLSQDNPNGKFEVQNIPMHLYIKQIDYKTYPPRALFSVDFNRNGMFEQIKKQEYELGHTISDTEIQVQVEKKIKKLRTIMPFTFSVSLDLGDVENVIIDSVTDKNGDDVMNSYFDIHIQSLGVDDCNWLDSGIFDF